MAWSVSGPALTASGGAAPSGKSWSRSSTSSGQCRWRDAALAWATEELEGTIRALQPIPSGSGTGITGYQVAGYLIQYATLKRHSVIVPGSTWDAICNYVRDPADAARLADSASNCELDHYAIPLYWRAADAGDETAASRLADLLAEPGDLNELRARANAGDRAAASRLADLLAEPGDLDQSPRLSLPGGANPSQASSPCPACRRPLRPPTGRPRCPAKTGNWPAVAAELRGLDRDGSRMAAAIRGALDMLLDGQHTGRYRWEQLHKTEKTHAGTLVEIALARVLRLADGTTLDYTIAGADVDCKFSHRLGGWMIPPEADGKLMLLVQASDEDGTWSAGLLRAAGENLSPAGNRDGKRALNDRGRAAVRWLHSRAPLQENALIKLPERDVAAIFALPSGQQRVNELFRRAQRMRVSRTVVATVAMQDDYMKRVRGGGGARDQLRAEGIVIFGDYAGDQVLASALGLPRPGPGEFVSARLVPLSRRPSVPGTREPGGAGPRDYARSIRLAGADWLLASAADPVGPAPALPR